MRGVRGERVNARCVLRVGARVSGVLTVRRRGGTLRVSTPAKDRVLEWVREKKQQNLCIEFRAIVVSGGKKGKKEKNKK